MRATHDSRDTLVLSASALGARVAGAIFLVSGVFAAVTGLQGETDTGRAVVGVIGALVGLALVLLPSARTFAFSRAERRLVMVWRNAFRTRREEVPLTAIVDARLDESRSSEGGNTWRIVLQLADGRTVPFTSYYSSGFASKHATMTRIRAFLDLPDNATATGTQPLTGDALRTARRRMTAVRFGVGIFALIFAGVGGMLFVREQQRLTTWRPVDATVLSTRVDEVSDSDGSTYRPVVVYRYWVSDREYTSSTVTPLSESRSGRWAHRLVARFVVGGSYPAYYDPADPSHAFLVRSRSIVAPVFMVFGVLALGLALFTLRNRDERQ